MNSINVNGWRTIPASVTQFFSSNLSKISLTSLNIFSAGYGLCIASGFAFSLYKIAKGQQFSSHKSFTLDDELKAVKCKAMYLQIESLKNDQKDIAQPELDCKALQASIKSQKIESSLFEYKTCLEQLSKNKKDLEESNKSEQMSDAQIEKTPEREVLETWIKKSDSTNVVHAFKSKELKDDVKKRATLLKDLAPLVQQKNNKTMIEKVDELIWETIKKNESDSNEGKTEKKEIIDNYLNLADAYRSLNEKIVAGVALKKSFDVIKSLNNKIDQGKYLIHIFRFFDVMSETLQKEVCERYERSHDKTKNESTGTPILLFYKEKELLQASNNFFTTFLETQLKNLTASESINTLTELICNKSDFFFPEQLKTMLEKVEALIPNNEPLNRESTLKIAEAYLHVNPEKSIDMINKYEDSLAKDMFYTAKVSALLTGVALMPLVLPMAHSFYYSLKGRVSQTA